VGTLAEATVRERSHSIEVGVKIVADALEAFVDAVRYLPHGNSTSCRSTNPLGLLPFRLVDIELVLNRESGTTLS
jgi:hypothetical protein